MKREARGRPRRGEPKKRRGLPRKWAGPRRKSWARNCRRRGVPGGRRPEVMMTRPGRSGRPRRPRKVLPSYWVCARRRRSRTRSPRTRTPASCRQCHRTEEVAKRGCASLLRGFRGFCSASLRKTFAPETFQNETVKTARDSNLLWCKELERLNILYDEDDSGSFLQIYTPVFNDNFFNISIST